MLSIQFSNRYEALRDALLARVGRPGSPFSAEQIVVPSSAMRRDLALAIADAHGVCANVDFEYLAQWLWRQIGRVVESVAGDSPFASSVLAWRIYPLLNDPAWHRSFPRLHGYLQNPDPLRRLDLATAIAGLLEQYITYRQDWMSAWLKGARVALKDGSPSHSEDQDWQAELWRRLSAQMGAEQEHPANRFFRALRTAEAAPAFALPESVHVFCLPAMPPLYMDVLIGLGRSIDVYLYVLNPCREYWFEIVDPKRFSRLVVRGDAGHHETGNRLLASWGGQTKGHIESLLDRAEDAPLDDRGYREDFPPSMLGQVQRSIFDLVELEPGGLLSGPADRSIEVHVCHSLTRELEALQDQLLALCASSDPPRLTEILVVTPDLEAAAPLIDAVFGNAPADRYLPFVVSGRGRSTVNAPARALLAVLAILPSRFPASALLELLQQPIIGRRFGIGGDELPNIEGWMRDSGICWGIDGEHRTEQDLPHLDRFSVEDGLQRLFLGYALPQHVSIPLLGRVPAGNPEGSNALDLGLFAQFFHRLTALRTDFLQPRTPDEWLVSLRSVLDDFLLPLGDELDDLKDLWGTLGELHANMVQGGVAVIPLPVIRSALQSSLDDPARGGAPTGSITFTSMTSLRNLPFRVICVLGLNDGAFPQVSRPLEFDLMAADVQRGDRQRRVDDRNVFLDLLLAARERLYLSYTGRSIRDNGILPASVVLSELIETLLPAMAENPADPASLAEARRRLIVEHPLQAFSEKYFTADGDGRLRSFNRELCAALRQSLVQRQSLLQRQSPAQATDVSATTLARGTDVSTAASAASAKPARDASATDAAADDAADDAAAEDETEADTKDEEAGGDDRQTERFFTAPVAAPGEEWRTVSLDRLIRFFANPCQFLLRDRLGIALYREEDSQSDDEPFLPDHAARQALAERLLPQAMQGLGTAELESLANAGIEYPPGTLGTTLLREEMRRLQRFAAAVKGATQSPCTPPMSAHVDFDLNGESWQISTVFSDLRAAGLVRHRYDDTRTRDYLGGWLTHLLLCAAAPQGVSLQTRWISRDGDYRLECCPEAVTILRALMQLYRQGLREPLHFFPKSAWEYIESGRKLGKARAKWHADYPGARGEDENAAYQLALRGQPDPIDAAFADSAEAVFGKIRHYLEDERLKVVRP